MRTKLATSSTTTVADTTPRVISRVTAVSITSSGATINWTTNEAGDSQVGYGLTTAYGSTSPLNGGLITTHAVILGALGSSTTYHLRVRSKDAAGNLTAVGRFRIHHTRCGPDAAGRLHYVARAECNRLSGVYTTLNLDVGSVTSYTVTGLAAASTYYFAVSAYDQNGAESGLSNEVFAIR